MFGLPKWTKEKTVLGTDRLMFLTEVHKNCSHVGVKCTLNFVHNFWANIPSGKTQLCSQLSGISIKHKRWKETTDKNDLHFLSCTKICIMKCWKSLKAAVLPDCVKVVSYCNTNDKLM